MRQKPDLDQRELRRRVEHLEDALETALKDLYAARTRLAKAEDDAIDALAMGAKLSEESLDQGRRRLERAEQIYKFTKRGLAVAREKIADEPEA